MDYTLHNSEGASIIAVYMTNIVYGAWQIAYSFLCQLPIGVKFVQIAKADSTAPSYGTAERKSKGHRKGKP